MKRFISGFLLGALIFGCLSSAAQNEAVQAILSDIKVQLDGSDMQLTDPVLVYNDRTYVPVRQIAEAVGKDVSFDDANRTVVIGNASVPAATKMTSDGLEAIYSYNQQKYIVKSSLIWDKYHISRTLSPDNKTLIIYKENNRTTNISVANCVINGIAGISYDDYENKVLPFIQGLN